MSAVSAMRTFANIASKGDAYIQVSPSLIDDIYVEYCSY